MKMASDDPNHTDWWLFTGRSMDEATDHNSELNDFFHEKRYEFHEELTGSNLKCLVRGDHKGLSDSRIIHVRDAKDIDLIDENTVVVIPDGSPTFEGVAHKVAKENCILITETGGKLCHLATVGREFGLTMYLLPDAMKKLPNGCKVSINTDDDNLTVPNYQGEDLEWMMKEKLTGSFYKQGATE
jgi:phosphohistidine swiveling domain-containing protein